MKLKNIKYKTKIIKDWNILKKEINNNVFLYHISQSKPVISL